MLDRDPLVELFDEPHHDGSPTYRNAGPHHLGDTITVRVRIPHAARPDRVRVRTTPDGEPHMSALEVERDASGASWWTASFALENPTMRYRFLLEGGAIGHAWLTAEGLSRHDVTDDADFRVGTAPPAPAWLDETVGYQIFPDRFAQSGAERPPPDWAIPAAWDDPIITGPGGGQQLYGGDLGGIEARLDHLERLGVNLIYLTPCFPGRSNHRYDASTFDRVDPHLGGDEALASLTAAAHARGMRVIGDITLNHTGDGHEWFQRAIADPTSEEAGFYVFDETEPNGYVAWHDVAALPKLDHRSTALATRFYDGEGSVVDRYLAAPFDLDGWRVDCANTTARLGETDLTREVGEATRRTVDRRGGAHGDGRWLIAEHCYDAGDDLTGQTWHGVMAYQWLSRPLWSWLRGDVTYPLMGEVELPKLAGEVVVAAMRHLGANIGWESRRGSMSMIDSHDSARFATVTQDRQRHIVGVAALMTLPGVPTLFAGSEVGAHGTSMADCRVPFPWDEARWDRELFDATVALAHVRRNTPALQRGSMRWIRATADSMTFVREHDERNGDRTVAVVHLNRADTFDAEIPLPSLIDVETEHAPDVRWLYGERAVVADGVVTLPGRAGATIALLSGIDTTD